MATYTESVEAVREAVAFQFGDGETIVWLDLEGLTYVSISDNARQVLVWESCRQEIDETITGPRLKGPLNRLVSRSN